MKEMTPKSIESFYRYSILGLAFVVAVCTSTFGLLPVVGPEIGLPDSLTQGMMFAAALSVLWAVLSIFITARRARSDYQSWLATLDFEILRRMAESPEISTDSRDVIIGFLNENHSGWSLGDNATLQKQGKYE